MPATRVLIVDDSAFARAVIAESLEAFGMEVVGEASDGIQALELYQRLRPDVVTMDVTMPGLDGINALRSVVEFDPNAQVVIVSTAGQEEVVVQALQSGAIGFLLKPFDPVQLMALLRRRGGVFAAAPADADRRRLYVIEAQRRIEALAEDARDLVSATQDLAVLDSIRRHLRALAGMATRIGDEPTRLVADAADRAASAARGLHGRRSGEFPPLMHDLVRALHTLVLAASRGEDDRVYANALGERFDGWVRTIRAAADSRTPDLALILDPDGGERWRLEGRLLREGVMVDSIESPTAIVERAVEVRPAVIVVVAESGRIDVPSTVRLIRESPMTALTPIIVLTARGDLPHKLAVFGAGADDLVVKPFEPEEIVARIQALVMRERRAREMARVS